MRLFFLSLACKIDKNSGARKVSEYTLKYSKKSNFIYNFKKIKIFETQDTLSKLF